MLKKMRGIVIAGGLGTRLRPLTLTRPKPLMPLVNAPLLEYQLYYLRQGGVHEVCFATNYMSDAVEATFGDGAYLNMQIVYAVEKEPLDTGGAIRNGYDAIPGDDCVIFNGDTIHAFDIEKIIKTHKQRNAEVTLTLRPVTRPHAYGVVEIDASSRVTAFKEPSEDQKRNLNTEIKKGEDLINAGLYIINKDVLETFPKRKANVEREVFPQLIAEGRRIYADIQTDFWIDIGRPSQYLEAISAVVNRKVKCPRDFILRGDSAVDANCKISEDAIITNSSAVSAEVQIHGNAYVTRSAILQGAILKEGCVVSNSIIGDNVIVEPYAEIVNSTLGSGTVISSYSKVGQI